MRAVSVWITSTWLSKFILDSRWIFPTGEILHFVGISMLLGFAVALDLRMLGVAKRMALAPLHRLLRWGVAGFALTMLSGATFIIAAPSQYLGNGVFWIKMLFLLLAGLNIGAFYLSGIYRRVEALGPGDAAPATAKVVAALSLFLWAGILFWGRMLAFLGIAF